MKDLELGLALSRLDWLKPQERLLLAELAQDPSELEAWSRSQWESLLGRAVKADLNRLKGLSLRCRADRQILEREGLRVLPRSHPAYPRWLGALEDAPALLYCRGAWPEGPRPWVSLVGTRQPTETARRAAFELAKEAAASGAVVVSGLARGLDAAAHQGALAGGGCTVAVLAHGLDRVYPPSHRRLAAEMVTHGGALLTEYAWGAETLTFRFPDRNRLIAGLSPATVVIQAPARSGALITARWALDQGREVLVHEAGLQGAQSAGSAALTEDGAKVIRGWQDLAPEVSLWN